MFLAAQLGVAIAIALLHLVLGIISKQRTIHLLFSILTLLAFTYVLASMIGYHVTDIHRYLPLLKIQMFVIPLFLTVMILFIAHYTGVKLPQWVKVYMVLFLLFPVVRLFHPATLIFSSVRTMLPYRLPWGETLHVFDAVPSGWLYVYYSLIVLSYIIVGWLLVTQYRKGDVKGSLAFILGFGFFFSTTVYDMIIITLGLHWPFMSEAGFVGILMPMTAYMISELVRVKEIEEKLDTSERYRNAIFNSMFQFSGLLDLDGSLIEINNSALQLFGIPREQLLGKKFHETSLWKNMQVEKENYLSAFQKALKGQFVRYETRHRNRDGQCVTVDFSLKPVFSRTGRVIAVVPEGRDITEQKKAEQTIHENNQELAALNEELTASIEELEATNEEYQMQNEELLDKEQELIASRERYRILFEWAGDAIFILHDMVIHDCNSQALALSGYSRDLLLERELTSLVQGDDVEEQCATAMRQQGEMTQYEWQLLRNDSTTLEVDVVITRMELSDGVYLQVMMRDVTERNKSRQLEQRLMQVQKMESLGTLAGGLAHDFNNVLAGIVGSLNLLQRYLSRETLQQRQEIEEFLQMGIDSAQRSTGVIRQMLTLAREDAMEMKSLDLNIVVRRLHEICKSTLPKSVLLDFKTMKEPMVLDGDEGQLDQVLLNLAVNASHAMTDMRRPEEPQGGTLTVEVFPGECGNGDDGVCVSISDAGVGMPEEIRERVFEPFYTTRVDDGGTGLGLAMVYSIVNRHNGTITLESEEGVGTTFTLCFPRSSMHKWIHRDKEITKAPGGSGKVLVVDDEKDLRSIVVSMLHELGYETFQTGSGEDALSLYSIQKPDVVLLDYSMPGFSGLEVYDALMKMDPEVKVILVSGKIDALLKNMAEERSIQNLLQKPYMMDELAALLHELMGEPRERA